MGLGDTRGVPDATRIVLRCYWDVTHMMATELEGMGYKSAFAGANIRGGQVVDKSGRLGNAFRVGRPSA